MAGLSLAFANPSEAEEAVQEALARAWERAEQGEHIESLRAWVAMVAANILRSGLRRLLTARRRERLLVNAFQARPTGQESAATDDLIDVIRAVRTLSPRQRTAVFLHYFEDLPLGVVAEAMHVKENAVKALLHRARRSLSKALGEPEEEVYERDSSG